MAEIHVLSRWLAEAFLAGGWSARDLAARGAEALNARPDWLRNLARRAVYAFEEPPDLEVLARFIAKSRALHKVRAGGLDDLVLRKPIFAEPRMAPAEGAPRTWDLPSLATEGDLAEWLGLSIGDLHWFADATGRLRHEGAGPLQHYARQWIPKPSGGFRLLEAPKSRLKAIQRRLLHGILDHVPAHDAAHGFVGSRSVLTYVRPHVAKRALLHMDLRDFFASIGRARIQALYRTLGYPTPIARLLAGLSTTRVSLEEWARAPRPHNADEVRARWHAGRFYCAPHLPQGAPTSPALANLSAFRLDLRLAGAARSMGADYTRYADDLAVSGDADFERRERRFYAFACRIIAEEGFMVNGRKTRTLRQGAQQRLTGVVLNRRTNVPRADYDRLKATLHNAVRFGPTSQNRDGHVDFRAHLTGRVAWVLAVNPERGRKLAAILATIEWPKDE